MFRKLRLELTLLNAGIIALLFVMLTAGVYFFVQSQMNERADFMLSRVAADIDRGVFHGFPFLPPPAHWTEQPPPPPPLRSLPFMPPAAANERPFPLVFFIQLNSEHQIETVSPSQPLPAEKLAAFVKSVQATGTNAGQLDFDDKLYFFHKSPRTVATGTLIVVEDFQKDRHLLRILMSGLMLIGTVCFIFSLLGSRFLANRAMQPIQKSWQQQKDFLTDASHELRTPLAVVQTNLEIVRSNQTESVAEQKKWFDNISESVAVMGYLVDSLLFLARMDSQQYSMEKKTFALDQAIANVIESFQPLAEAAGLDLTSSLEAGLVMCGDEFRIKQVVGILIDNALRHSTAGSIAVSLQKQGKSVILSVTDSGEGIEKHHQKKIFDRFYQVEASRSRKGVGLGLSIAKCICETHGGSIRVVSERGTGSTFFVTLPLSV